MNTVKYVGGHADDENIKQSAPGPQTQPYDLESALQKLDTMYKYRNDEIRDNDKDGKEIRNLCEAHIYTDFEDYQKKKNRYLSVSLGDINDAIDDIAYCTCNARQKPGCDCVARTSGNRCSCNVRYIYDCTCVSRNGNKYTPYCTCNSRVGGCSCVSRTPSVSCTCNARCSCNIVNEYTEKEPVSEECTCVARTYSSDHCECNGRTVSYDQVAPGGYDDVTYYTPCSCNARTYDRIPIPGTWNQQFQNIYRCTCVSRGIGSCGYVRASNGCLCVARATTYASCGKNTWRNYEESYSGGCQCYMRTTQPYSVGSCKCVSRDTIEDFCEVNVIKS